MLIIKNLVAVCDLACLDHSILLHSCQNLTLRALAGCSTQTCLTLLQEATQGKSAEQSQGVCGSKQSFAVMAASLKLHAHPCFSMLHFASRFQLHPVRYLLVMTLSQIGHAEVSEDRICRMHCRPVACKICDLTTMPTQLVKLARRQED